MKQTQMVNVVPVHKKEDEMLVKYYCPIRLLSILGKILKELYIISFSFVFKVIDFSHLPNLVFFQEIHVLPNYSKTHEIQIAFDEDPTVDVRGVF